MGRPKRGPADRISTNLRLSPELHERLRVEAEARDVSFTWLCERLLRESIERLIPVGELRFFRE